MLVDVFIPYFKNLHLVPQTIDSVLTQRGVDVVLHLVNDCSTEKDTFLKERYAKNENIRWYKTQENCGPYKIANGLYYKMESEYFVIVDSDDIMLPNHISDAISILTESRSDFYSSSMRQFLNSGEEHSEYSKDLVKKWPIMLAGASPVQLRYPVGVNGTLVGSKEAFHKLNGFDGNMHCGADIEFIQRAQYPGPQQCRVAFSSEITALRRICGNSMSNNDPDFGQGSEARNKVIEENYRRYEIWNNVGEIKNARIYGTLDRCDDVFEKWLQYHYETHMRKSTQVIACLASIPSRERALEKTISSLINQVDRIYVCLNGYGHTPLFLNHTKINVTHDDNSRGDAAKFRWVDNLNGYVFICDDDIAYPKDYVGKMKKAINKYRCLISACGSSFKSDQPLQSFLEEIDLHRLQQSIDKDTHADILGTGVLGFHSEDLSLNYEDFIDFNMADISLLRIARRDSIERVVIQHRDKWILRSGNDKGIYEETKLDDRLETRKINDIRSKYPSRPATGDVTAVLLNYKRTDNTNSIIERLKEQTVPVTVWVWNNGPDKFYHPMADWVINSDKNVHGHVLPYLYRQASTEFICRMDDDLIPADNMVLEEFISEMRLYGDTSRILCGHGVRIQDGMTYRESSQMGCGPSYPMIIDDTYVDIAKGRFTFFRQEFADSIPFDTSHVHADLTTSFGLSNNKRLYHIIPRFLEGRLQELPDAHDDGTPRGYSSAKDHYDIRNRLTQEWVAGQCS